MVIIISVHNQFLKFVRDSPGENPVTTHVTVYNEQLIDRECAIKALPIRLLNEHKRRTLLARELGLNYDSQSKYHTFEMDLKKHLFINNSRVTLRQVSSFQRK